MQRTTRFSQGGLSAVLALGACIAVLLSMRLDVAARTPGAAKALYPAPVLSADQLTRLAGGFAPALADVYWIRAVGAPPEIWDDPRGVVHMYDLLDRTTALDPRFEIPYHFGGILLSIEGERPDLANGLLGRAERTFPDDWRYPFYHGFNNLYHATDFADAARAMRRAADLPGAPPFLGGLATHLEQGGRDPRVMVDLIDRMLNVIQEPRVRRHMLERRAELVARIRPPAGVLPEARPGGPQ